MILKPAYVPWQYLLYRFLSVFPNSFIDSLYGILLRNLGKDLYGARAHLPSSKYRICVACYVLPAVDDAGGKLDIKNRMKDMNQKKKGMETAVIAAGCFWHVEDYFSKVPGVLKTRVGYAGGNTENPTYRQVSSGKTGHAESVEIVFDPKKISFGKILAKFWQIHDPTTLNRQGPDVGTNYRSAIFCQNEAQIKAALRSRDALQKKLPGKHIVTEIVKTTKFNPAEEFHQKYYEKQGMSSCGDCS